MAEQKRKPKKKQKKEEESFKRGRRILRNVALIGGGTVAGVGIAAAAGTAIAARVISTRDQFKEDPYADVPYGLLPNSEHTALVAQDGTKLHIERAGEGPPVIFTHGFSLNSNTWHHQFEHFSQKHRTIAWDIRGHGRSAPTLSDYALQTMAEDLATIVQNETPDEPVVLVGHSMGGMVTVQLLAHHPELVEQGRIRGVVLSDTGMGDIIGGLFRFGSPAVRAAIRPFIEVGYARLGRNPLHLERLRGRGTDLHYAWARLMGFGPKPSHRHVRFVREMLDQVATDVWVGVLPSIVEMELRPHLSGLRVPVLVLVGSHDRVTPLPVARALATSLPDARLEVIEGAGHCPMIEKHDAWNEAVERFISDLP